MTTTIEKINKLVSFLIKHTSNGDIMWNKISLFDRDPIYGAEINEHYARVLGSHIHIDNKSYGKISGRLMFTLRDAIKNQIREREEKTSDLIDDILNTTF